ncbi:MAG: citrate synthase [Candidatus Tectomicrobia bacterium]|nr:citrate synthase [Candidatus Tectomicrobia bacterium]
MSEATDQVIAGLEGVLACESSIAFIDGSIPELSFRGYHINDIAQTLTFEQTTFLLWHDHIPQGDELKTFSDDLAARRAAPGAVVDVLRAMPASAHPMAGLRTAVSMLGALDPSAEDISAEDNLRKAKNLTAQMPTIVAAQARLQQGQEPIAPDPSLGHAANYYYMLSGEQPDETTTRTFDTTLILYAEHETNASTFACRCVVGTESDYYSSVVAGIGAIKGPLHGGAIDGAMEMFIDIGSPEKAAAYVDKALEARQKLSGFGHRVYRAGDPRAGQLRGMAKKLGETKGDTKWFDIAEAAEERMRESKGIIANVDYFAAPVLYHLGFPLNIFTNVVASARIVGWTAHILEQYANNRLIRPRARYVGERNRTL